MNHRAARVAAAVLLGVIFALAFVGTRVLFQVPENAATIRRICETSNSQGTKQKQLWEFIIELTADDPNPVVTPEQQAQRLAQFRVFLDDIYRPQECDK